MPRRFIVELPASSSSKRTVTKEPALSPSSSARVLSLAHESAGLQENTPIGKYNLPNIFVRSLWTDTV
jgi:hypothetical protein